MIMGAIAIVLIKVAFINPERIPMIKQTGTTRTGGRPLDIISAPATAETPITDPTERSIPAVSMTKVIPTEHIPTIATCLSTLNILVKLRKRGSAMVNTTISAIHANRMPYLDQSIFFLAIITPLNYKPEQSFNITS
jgi:hypothetical protein